MFRNASSEPVSALIAATAVCGLTGLAKPTPIRVAVNAIYRASDVAIRVAPALTGNSRQVVQAAEALSREGVRVGKPLRREVFMPNGPDGWHVTLWEWISGETMGPDSPLDAFRQLGASANTIHSVPVDVLTRNGVVLPNTQTYIFQRVDKRLARARGFPGLDDATHRELQRRLEALKHQIDERTPSDDVVIHGDYKPENAIYDGSQVTVIDLEHIARGYRHWDHTPLLAREERLHEAYPLDRYDAFADGYGWHVRDDDVARLWRNLKMLDKTVWCLDVGRNIESEGRAGLLRVQQWLDGANENPRLQPLESRLATSSSHQESWGATPPDFEKTFTLWGI